MKFAPPERHAIQNDYPGPLPHEVAACSECAPLYYSKKIAAYENSKAGPSGLSNRRIWSE